MHKTYKLLIAVSISLLLLVGCMYPTEQRMQNQPPHEEQIQTVQQSVERFQQETGVIPIHTRESDTPLYHRYAIDFNRLIPQYLERLPDHSFEADGRYNYVLVDVEENPTVKLIDLQMSQTVSQFQRRVNAYLQNGNYLPIAQDLGGGYFLLDHEELNLNHPPTVQSPYSQQSLPLIVDQKGKAGIDYRIDLQGIIESHNNLANLEEEGQDVRSLLLEESYFAPAHSFAMTVKDGETVFIEAWKQ